MPIDLDPEIRARLEAQYAARPGALGQVHPDVFALRAATDLGLEAAFARLPDADGVETELLELTSPGGAPVVLHWSAKAGTRPGSAVVYAHGGGMVCGSTAIYDRLVRHYVDLTGVPFLSVDYGLAPERRDGLAHDVWAALQWLAEAGGRLGVEPGRIALMGDSGGGGVAAAAAIIARDNGFPLARQILVYPMLDDRNLTPTPASPASPFWTHDNNRLAWSAILDGRLEADDIHPRVAPARLVDFAGLAPAYIEVGELDIFREECVRYAQGLWAAGVSCELLVFPGAPHGYDILGRGLHVSERGFAARSRIVRSL